MDFSSLISSLLSLAQFVSVIWALFFGSKSVYDIIVQRRQKGQGGQGLKISPLIIVNIVLAIGVLALSTTLVFLLKPRTTPKPLGCYASAATWNGDKLLKIPVKAGPYIDGAHCNDINVQLTYRSVDSATIVVRACTETPNGKVTIECSPWRDLSQNIWVVLLVSVKDGTRFRLEFRGDPEGTLINGKIAT